MVDDGWSSMDGLGMNGFVGVARPASLARGARGVLGVLFA